MAYTQTSPVPGSPVHGQEAHAGLVVRASAVGIAFRGGVRALDGVSLHVGAGEFLALVGPSGCGKSTMLRLIAGLIDATEGTLEVEGVPPRDARRTKRDVAFVFQQPALLPWRTARGNVRLPLEIAGSVDRDGERRIDEALALVGLQEFARAYPHTLSGGMRMRVSLARALATRPGLMLLDEPFGALDDITRTRLNEDLLRLRAADKWAAVFVTHNVAEAVFLSDRVLVMTPRPGRIAAEIAVAAPPARDRAWRASGDFAAQAGRVAEALEQAGGGT